MRTVNRQHLLAASDHGLHPEFAKVADMIGMEVGDENPCDACTRELHRANCSQLPGPVSTI